MIRFLAATCLALLAACASTPPAEREVSEELALPDPSLEKIADGVWIHKSYRVIEPWGPILSQGLVIETRDDIVLIDTAWNDADTEELLTLIEAELGARPTMAIVTHAHADKMGGVDALHARGVTTIAHAYSNMDAPARNLTPTKDALSLKAREAADLTPAISNGVALTAFYPGPGHTRDNIVVYYAPAKVLFGGCLIRPGGSNNLGNTADGDVENWADAVRAVAQEFPEAEIVIPSHGPMGGAELLDHTIALAEAAND